MADKHLDSSALMMMPADTITVWGFRLPGTLLDAAERDYIIRLPEHLPSIEWLWSEMDRVWHAQGLNNRLPLNDRELQCYYSHPVWIANGIFTAVDPTSVDHRTAIARHVRASGHKEVADYGGGFGELARAVAATSENTRVSIIEPHVSRVAEALSADNQQIRFVPCLEADKYDSIIAQDILEHLANPLAAVSLFAKCVKPGGELIIANCFFPVIQCHLPATFHLRHTFRFIVDSIGLRYAGSISGAEHAKIFVRDRNKDINIARLRTLERLSQTIGPTINHTYRMMEKLKKALGR